MKTTPVQNSPLRGSRTWAAALIAAGLSASLAIAQSPSATGGATSASTTQGTSGAPGSGSGSGSASSTSPRAYGSTAGTSATTSSDNPSMSSTSRDTSSGQSSSLKRSDRRFITKAADTNQKELAASQLAAQRATDPQIRSFAQQISSDHQRVEQELVQLAQRKGVNLDQLADSSSGSTRRATDTSMSESTNAGIATDHGAPRATGAANTANTPAAAGVATNSATATSGSDTMSGSSSSATWNSSSDMANDRHIRRLARKTGQDFDHDYVDLIVDSHEDAVKLFQRAAKDAQDAEVRSFASSHLASLQAHLDQANSLMKSAAE